MRRMGVTLVMLIMTLVLGFPGRSDAQLVLYDDFSSELIDPTKWFGGVANGGAGNPTTEIVRQIEHGRLRLRLNQYGLTNSNSGISGGQYRLAVQDPASITTMQAGVTVLGAEALLCPTNAGVPARTRAQIVGGFFNDGSSTGAGDRTGDISAGIQKTTDPTLGNIIVAFIVRCADASCSSTAPVSLQNLVTTWALYQPHTLTVTWDAANNQFIYSAKPVRGSTETVTLPYTQTDSAPPAASFRQLAINNSAANCSGSRKHAFMDVLFDRVMVNQ